MRGNRNFHENRVSRDYRRFDEERPRRAVKSIITRKAIDSQFGGSDVQLAQKLRFNFAQYLIFKSKKVSNRVLARFSGNTGTREEMNRDNKNLVRGGNFRVLLENVEWFFVTIYSSGGVVGSLKGCACVVGCRGIAHLAGRK